MAPLRSSLSKTVGKLFGMQATSQLGSVIQLSPFTATGGNFTYSLNGYKYHVFLSDGEFTVPEDVQQGTVEFLIVGGGAGAGAGQGSDYGRSGGGGGAGGLRCSFSGLTPGGGGGGAEAGLQISAGTYPVTVGNGGSGGTSNTSQPGGDSSWGPASAPERIVAGGGGKGSGGRNNAGQPGGSGGGASAQEQDNAPANSFPGSPNLGGNAVSPTGFNPIVCGYGGGRCAAESNTGGGGGGAGEQGEDGSDNNNSWNGTGGVGKAIPTNMVPSSYGTPGPSAGRWFAQGGFASSENSGGTYVAAGGGGSNPDHWTSSNGVNGVQNTGGGGGGRGDSQVGGNGGSGIVILRYSE